MKNFTAFVALFFSFTTCSFSQRIYWASRVVQVSSETSLSNYPQQYKATQALGKPNRSPGDGATPCAWQPATPDSGEEYLRVSFDTLTRVKQIIICENLGAGSLQNVYCVDASGTENLVFSNTATPDPKQVGKVWSIILKTQTSYPVASVRITLNTSKVPRYSQIDAIAVSPDSVLFSSKINVAPKNNKSILKERLGESINSKTRELNPIISADGKTLYFTRWGHPENLGEPIEEQLNDGTKRPIRPQDAWLSSMGPQNTWQQSTNFGSPINNGEHNAICSISADQKTVMLLNEYLPDGRMKNGISVSKKEGKGWGPPVAMKIKNFNLIANKGGYLTEYALSQDKRILIVAGQRKDTFGERDLYVCFAQKNGEWSEPLNLGSKVNTADEEGSPYLASDGKTLYFSTEGLPGYGKNDIFIVRRLDDTWTKWSEPENLGPDINTSGWDGYFSISASGEFAYLCSDFASPGDEDIYRLKMTDAVKPEPVAIISGTVLNAVDKKPVSADIFSETLVGLKDTLQTEYDPETGEYKIILPLRKNYGISPSKKGFLAVSENIDLTNEKRFREIRRNLFIVPIEEGQKVPLNNVFFAQSKSDVLEGSFSELDRLVVIMKENPTMEILLEGHTDNQGIETDNVKLSEERVQGVKKYIVDKGITDTRIKCKGIGSGRPLTSNHNEESRKKNRRVEFLITKK